MDKAPICCRLDKCRESLHVPVIQEIYAALEPEPEYEEVEEEREILKGICILLHE